MTAVFVNWALSIGRAAPPLLENSERKSRRAEKTP